MTKEKALISFDSFGKTFTLDDARLDIHILINKIYDDFESRICVNCKFVEQNALNRYYCSWEAARHSENKVGFVLKNFGCNNFEKKLI